MKQINNKLIIICSFLMMSLFIISCKKEKKEVQNTNEQITIMTNKSDPMFLKGNTATGKKIELYGDRNSEGIPSKLTHIYIRESDEKALKYIFDDNMRVVKMIDHDGAEININWLSGTTATATIITADGKNELSTFVDFKASPNKPAKRNISTVGRKGNLKLKLEPTERLTIPEGARHADQTVKVFVEQCGEPAIGTVDVIAKDMSNHYLGTFPAKYVSEGVYETTIPNHLAPQINQQEVCKAINEMLGSFCEISSPELHIPTDVLCTQISIAIASSVAGLPVATLFESICVSLNHGLELFCTFKGNTFAEKLNTCDVLFEYRNYEDVYLSGRVHAIPYNVMGTPVKMPAAGPYSNLNVNLGNNTIINNIILFPSNPSEDEDYFASSNVSCLKAGSIITISVVGTDLYTDEIRTVVQTDLPYQTITLEVPGAETGVQDKITLLVELPNGTFVKKEASLVFQ